jgi:N-methylhydantoinase A/oxoprolinase/acetone carboxylase beta subunit
MRIGVDVGGTNTDAVVLDDGRVVSACKRPTTRDIVSGLTAAVREVLHQGGVASRVDALVIGTTHLTNALVERQSLNPVGVIRIGLPATAALPPQCGWPADLVAAIGAEVVMVRGGHESDGRLITELDEAAILRAAQGFRARGLRSVALTSVFSPVVSLHEERAAALVARIMPDVHVTRSAELGGVGLLERENAAIINAALSAEAARLVAGLASAVAELGLRIPAFLTQNDGTILSLDLARRFPVLTFASGPTNSMRGAFCLCGIPDALVADVGGTTTDIGTLIGGYPRQAAGSVELGGIRTAFRMPDLLALALGGGTVIRPAKGGPPQIGPDSVGLDLTRRARVFGGPDLTATDIAVARGKLLLGDARLLDAKALALAAAAEAAMQGIVEDGIDRARTGSAGMPLILVGGGAPLIGDDLRGVSQVLRPEHGAVANAIGAAAAEVGASLDRIVTMAEATRADTLAALCAEAEAAAVASGARPGSVRIHAIEETQVAYAAPETRRLRLRAIGALDAARLAPAVHQQEIPCAI